MPRPILHSANAMRMPWLSMNRSARSQIWGALVCWNPIGMRSRRRDSRFHWDRRQDRSQIPFILFRADELFETRELDGLGLAVELDRFRAEIGREHARLLQQLQRIFQGERKRRVRLARDIADGRRPRIDSVHNAI